ncbi:MAG: THUMP domain-containing protein [Chitinophagales bacterium]
MNTENFRMVAKTIFGLEEICASELRKLGAENIEIHNRAVSFEGNDGVMYKANLYLRTALRILVPIHEFEVEDEHDFYDKMKAINWSDYLFNDDTLAIDTVLNTSLFNHSQYISQKAKDAIVDQFRERTGKRPSVDLDRPTVRFHIHIFFRRVTIALDSSGDSLHKRGYREKTNLAPVNEALAAGLVLLSGWNGRNNFIDPMCGSGTILIEAAMIAANIPAGIHREWFGFQNWKVFKPYNEELWLTIYNSAIDKISHEEVRLYGGDVSPHVARKAKENVKRAKVEDMVQIRNCNIRDFDTPEGGGVVVVNPPYGERMDKDDLSELYKTIGDSFKQKFKGYDCWMISSNLDAFKHVGLRPSRKIVVYNGQLECRFMKYTMYEGTKKLHKVKA